MTFSCPMCEYQNSKGSTFCERCLVVFEKYEKKIKGEQIQISASSYLLDLWSHVVNDYGNKEFHEKFIQTALAENNLPFASQQYRKMTELNPADDIAQKMKEKILQLAILTFIPPQRTTPNSSFEGMSIVFKFFIFFLIVGFFVLLLSVFIKP